MITYRSLCDKYTKSQRTYESEDVDGRREVWRIGKVLAYVLEE